MLSGIGPFFFESENRRNRKSTSEMEYWRQNRRRKLGSWDGIFDGFVPGSNSVSLPVCIRNLFEGVLFVEVFVRLRLTPWEMNRLTIIEGNGNGANRGVRDFFIFHFSKIFLTLLTYLVKSPIFKLIILKSPAIIASLGVISKFC